MLVNVEVQGLGSEEAGEAGAQIGNLWEAEHLRNEVISYRNAEIICAIDFTSFLASERLEALKSTQNLQTGSKQAGNLLNSDRSCELVIFFL